MEYQIALSPSLGLSAEDFVNVWNEDAEARAVAEAKLVSSSSTHYEPMAMAILISIGTGIASSVIYDLIKTALAKRGVHKAVTVTDVSKPHATAKQIIVTGKEDKVK
jgi:hypothetical protein